MVRLPSDRPLLLYACSALYPIAPTEAQFVRRWIEEIRSSADPRLRSAAVLVRPHPTRAEEWADVNLSDLPDVTLYGSLPLDERSKEDYFESLYYSSAVIGLNTSAFLEAAIVGRPVHTIVIPEFVERQEGTTHFHYLKSVGGGVLQLARSFDEHRAQLSASLGEPARHDRQRALRDRLHPPAWRRSAGDRCGRGGPRGSRPHASARPCYRAGMGAGASRAAPAARAGPRGCRRARGKSRRSDVCPAAAGSPPRRVSPRSATPSSSGADPNAKPHTWTRCGRWRRRARPS